MAPVFRCPHCAAALADESAAGGAPGSLVCVHAHRFDRSRDGYVNLLPSGRLKGAPAGDDEAMVRSRRAVFDAGLYDPLIAAVAAAAAADAPRHVLDAGCGEGSYLARAAALTGAPGWGVDISKHAIARAARRHRGHRFAVASVYALPFFDAAFDVVLNVFSPRSFSEMGRVLRPGGVAIVATPAPDHLHELTALLYDSPRAHEPDPSPTAELTHRERFVVSLDNPDHRAALLQMTPYWWSAPPDRRAIVAQRLTQVTVHVEIARHRAPWHHAGI